MRREKHVKICTLTIEVMKLRHDEERPSPLADPTKFFLIAPHASLQSLNSLLLYFYKFELIHDAYICESKHKIKSILYEEVIVNNKCAIKQVLCSIESDLSFVTTMLLLLLVYSFGYVVH